MKRHYIYSFVCILMFSLLFSCDDFLNENPKDKIPEEDAYKSLTDLYYNAVASLYNNIGGYSDSQGLQGTGRGIYDLNTFTTDEAIMPTRGGDWYDGGFWQGLFLHRWGVDNDAIQAYRAEVRAFRALYYYHLMDLFGRVPLIISSAIPLKEVKQNSRKEVFDFIVKELQESAPLLAQTYSNRSGSYYGRITRPVVHFLLAKLVLNAEIYADDNWTDTQYPDGRDIYFEVDGNRLNAWQTVEAYCDSITAAGYRLEDNYEANFAVYNESSAENIFTIPMSKTLYTNQMQYLFRSRHYNHAKAYGLGGENGSSATVEVLRTFGYDTQTVDPRFDKCYFAGVVYDLKGKVITLDDGTLLEYFPWKVDVDISNTSYEKTAGARMKKYEIDETATKDGKLMENDIVLYRYADVLLMKSEAKVRNGENGDVELNLVRARVNAPFRTATLESLLSERQLEFAWEGWRRQDLVRFRQYTRAYTSRPRLPGEESGYTTVFPIPEKIRLMNPNLTQNPGY